MGMGGNVCFSMGMETICFSMGIGKLSVSNGYRETVCFSMGMGKNVCFALPNLETMKYHR